MSEFSERVKDFKISGVRILGQPITGTIIGIDEVSSNYLNEAFINTNNNKPTESQANLLQALYKNGYFSDSEYSLSSAYVHLTSACNLHCVGCYSYECERNRKETLSTAQIYTILDNLKNSGVQTITFSGGEPFLRSDIAEILKYAKKTLEFPGIVVASNGTLPLERYKESAGYMDLLSFSIDGYKENIVYLRDPDILPKIIKNLEGLKNLTNLSMIVTLHKKNLHDLPQYIELSSRLQIPFSISIFTVSADDPVFKDYILNDDDFDELARMSEGYENIEIMDSAIEGDLGCKEACGAGKTMVSISANGDIYPCHMLQTEKFKMGNALADNIAGAALKGSLYSSSVDHIDDCAGCEYKYLCGGGCRYRSYAYFNGDMNRADKCCPLYKSVFSKKLNKLLYQ